MSQGCEETQERGLKNEAPARAYSTNQAAKPKKKRVHRRPYKPPLKQLYLATQSVEVQPVYYDLNGTITVHIYFS